MRIQIDRMLQALVARRFVLLQFFMLAGFTIPAEIDEQVIISNRHGGAP
jgi:hypothetical protein